MDFKALLSDEVQEYIFKHQNEDVSKLALKLGKEKHPLATAIINQVKGRQKAKTKIPKWLKEGILFPPALSLEQSSSEATAAFKAELVSGYKLIDLSAGFGVDAYYFSKTFSEVVLVEPNRELAEIVQHNFKCLGIKNATFINSDAESFMAGYPERADCIYIDPSRRSGSNQRLFRLNDCQPNIIQLLPKLWQIAPTILIKTAPILDIQAAIEELEDVKKVIVLSLFNEVKEVLYLLEKSFSGETLIQAVDLKKSGKEKFEFTQGQEKESQNEYSFPLEYLYEPNAAVLKAGAFKSIAIQYGLKKLHQHSHLYTSHENLEIFPGRKFKVLAQTKPEKKCLKEWLPGMKANVTLRNYRGSVKDFLKKTGIKEGGEKYLFATTLLDEKQWLLICEKIT